jgi:hypothetical protein
MANALGAPGKKMDYGSEDQPYKVQYIFTLYHTYACYTILYNICTGYTMNVNIIECRYDTINVDDVATRTLPNPTRSTPTP